MHILALESSCDDTAASVIKVKRGQATCLSHIHFSQIRTHAKYGGVIPEVAAREHAVTVVPTFQEALRKAHIPLRAIDLLAVTQGPGLAPALSVGIDAGRILSGLFSIPLVGINHIEGHIASVWPCKGLRGGYAKTPELPALALVVSGGHTELLLVRKLGQYRLLGKTRDDAAGESFDKVATLLGFPYPGGPEISKRALQGNPRAILFPRPMLNDPSLDFSFSGLKTAVRYLLDKKKKRSTAYVADVCASFERAVVDVLIAKTLRAAKQANPKSVLLVGGVAANMQLRNDLAVECKKIGLPLFTAPQQLTADNATMIGLAAAFNKHNCGSRIKWKTMEALPGWELGR